MLSQNHHRPRLCVIAAVVAAALVAAACGGGTTTTAPEPAAATTTAATTQPAAPETATSAQEPASDIETGGAAEPDEAPATTTIAAEENPSASEGDALVTTTTTTEPPTTTGPETVDCPEGQHPDDGGGCHPDDGTTTTTPEPEPAPTTTPTTTTTTTTVPEPATTTTVPEPATTTTTVPEPEGPELDESTHLDLSPYSPGQIVAASELWPDSDFPADYVCQIFPDGDIDDEDGNFNCWLTSQVEEWTPPAAGVVPEVVTVCSTNQATWGDGTCTPPGTWITNTYSPSSMSDEVPRVVAGLAEFLNGCSAVVDAPCQWMLALMKWPIDYLGARPSCIVSEYTRRIEHFARTGDVISGSVTERFGWHNCVTAIDPPAPGAALTDGGNDIGLRLSDAGVTLAERCRLVLPEDVQLETKFYRPFTRFEEGHAGCDAWAAWIEDVIAPPGRAVSKTPQCYRSTNLAQEWMEHHHGVPENYFGFFGC